MSSQSWGLSSLLLHGFVLLSLLSPACAVSRHNLHAHPLSHSVTTSSSIANSVESSTSGIVSPLASIPGTTLPKALPTLSPTMDGPSPSRGDDSPGAPRQPQRLERKEGSKSTVGGTRPEQDEGEVRLFARADVDGDGFLSLQEFLAMGEWALVPMPSKLSPIPDTPFSSPNPLDNRPVTQATKILPTNQPSKVNPPTVPLIPPVTKFPSPITLATTLLEVQAGASDQAEFLPSLRSNKFLYPATPDTLKQKDAQRPCLLYARVGQRAPFANPLQQARPGRGCYQVCPRPGDTGEAWGGPFGADPYYGYGLNSIGSKMQG